MLYGHYTRACWKTILRLYAHKLWAHFAESMVPTWLRVTQTIPERYPQEIFADKGGFPICYREKRFCWV